ncbi:MAG: serine hydrolase [Synechococcales cyanobacterium RM1_1_8]|nr:serine hydrolase [Synechococcales cyanobacterium RM1_1_8]
MQLPDRVISALQTALDANRPAEVPGAVAAILTPEGEWFGASGVANVAENRPLRPDDRFEAGSITKTFVAATLLQLVENGQISLNDTLTTWLTTSLTDPIPNASEITIKQLLNHTSGIADYLDIFTARAVTNPTLFLQEWEPEQLVGFVNGVEPFFAPGTDWRYSNTNYILAGEVIESVTGNGYGQEIRDRILNPLGLDNTFVFGEEEIPGGYISSYWDFNRDGVLDDLSITNLSWASAAGSIISNAEDLADFFDGLLVDGALLEPETLSQMLDTQPVDSPNYDSYGLGIGTLESRDRFWYVHRGQTLGFRSNLWYSPLEEITYVELLNGRSNTNLVSDLLPTYRREIEQDDAIPIPAPENQSGTFSVAEGTTSLFLDFSLLETAGLIIQNTTPTATPFSNQFQLGFEIADSTDFRFDSVPFAPLGGSIQHTGEIEFLFGDDALLSIGDFEIGFEGDRITETNSGFYVADTLEDGLGLDILFDISNPERLIIQNDELTLADADLLLAPELAQVLGLNDFVGADLGDTRIDAVLSPDMIPPVVPPTPPTPEAPQSLFGSNGDDNLTGGSGNDNLYGNEGQNTFMGMAGNDQLFGGNQSDIAFGGEGDDVIYGNEGRDLLSGDAGDDALFGGGGDDVLLGVTGNDTLYGNHGSDLFVFGRGDGLDTIVDFQVGMDRIGLIEGELVYSDLSIMQQGLDTLLGVGDRAFAVLKFTNASRLGEESFATVADGSNPAQAIAILSN